MDKKITVSFKTSGKGEKPGTGKVYTRTFNFEGINEDQLLEHALKNIIIKEQIPIRKDIELGIDTTEDREVMVRPVGTRSYSVVDPFKAVEVMSRDDLEKMQAHLQALLAKDRKTR